MGDAPMAKQQAASQDASVEAVNGTDSTKQSPPAEEQERAMNGEDRSSAGAKDEEHRPHLHPRPGEHWEHHPRPKEGDLDADLPDAKTPDSKADALSAAQKGDHCVLVPSTSERLIVSGPFLQFLGYEPEQALWRASVMVVSPPAQGSARAAEPTLHMYDEGKEHKVQGLQLHEHCGWVFRRFDFTAVLGEQPRSLAYSLDIDGCDPEHRYTVALASSQQGWRWGFHSCNGLSPSVDLSKWKDPHLWEDVMAMHDASPLHALMGGGDQLYNDGLWGVPSLRAWLAIEDDKERVEHEWTEDMQRDVTEFLFNHYRVHFNSRPALARAYSCIPQMQIWDDHDIFDGWGSYPDHLQTCPVFQGVYKVSEHFYLLFQHQTTRELSRKLNDLFGPPGTYSFLRQLGERVALLAPDSRAQRSTKRIISPEAYEQIFARLEALPPSVRHLVVVPTVPVVFPKLPFSEQALSTINGSGLLKGVLQKTGLADGILDRFKHADLLDDLTDHWDANSHQGERRFLIERLQAVARARQLRVSFISGDVHCAAVGRLYTRPKMAHLRHDHRFMPQIVSSAIWNCPPPNTFMKALEDTDRAKKLNHNTKEKMVRIFKDNPTKKLMPARNWLTVEELPIALPTANGQPGIPENEHHVTKALRPSYYRDRKTLGALIYTLRIENPEHQTSERKTYPVICPQYARPPVGQHPAVRRSNLLRRCICLAPQEEADPLKEL